MAPQDLSLRIDHTRALVPTKEAQLGLEFIGDSGSSLTLTSGLPIDGALKYGGFGNDSFVGDAIKSVTGGLAPQTLGTAVYENIHLVGGTQLVIESKFTPGDQTHNDEAFVLIKNLATGDISPAKIANVVDVNKAGGSQNFKNIINIRTTGDYNVLIGVADIGDKLHPSSITIKSMTVVVPSGQYYVQPTGVLLGDGSLLGSDGSLQVNGLTVPKFLADSGSATIAGLESLLASKVISNDGGSLISQDGGGLIGEDGSSLISQDGGGLIGEDGSSLISQDGGGFGANLGLLSGAQLAQLAAGIGAHNASNYRAVTAESTSGLTGDNYGALDANGVGRAVPDDGPANAYMPPVPGLEVSASPATALRYDTRSAVADLGNGRYVVAFAEYDVLPNGSRAYTIRAQAINADGSLSGPELTVNNQADSDRGTASELDDPSVAATGDGGFVVAWVNGQHPRPPGLSTGSDIFARRYNADGTPQGPGFQLNTTVNTQYSNSVKVTALAGGGYAATWSLYESATGSNVFTIQGKVFNADGSQRGSDLTLSGSTFLANVYNPTAAAKPDGGFVMAFQGNAPNPQTGGTLTGIGLQAYDANGRATTRGPTLVQASDTNQLTKPNIAILANGDIAVAWVDATQHAVYSQVLDAKLVAKSSEPTYVGGSYSDFYGPPAIAALADGRFVVGWTENSAAQAQILNDDNTLYGPEFAVYAPGGGDATNAPALVQLSTGALVASSTHEFNSLAASDVRALPINVGSTGASGPTTAGTAFASGSAVHGYVSGGTVFADANGNGTLDAGEVSATTTAAGAFALAPGAVGPLVLTGGIDLATGKAFTGRYTAPAGSHAINALTTLIQGVLTRGADIGTAEFKVATALGMAADAELTNLDPMTAGNSTTGKALLLANALIADISDLATAAGSPDALGAFAAAIAAKAGFTTFDPSGLAAMAATGLSGQILTDATAIAAAVKTLLAARSTSDGTDATTLVSDVNRIEAVVHNGAAAFAAAIGTGTTAAVAADYSGTALQAKFDSTPVVVPGTSETPGITPSTVGVYRFFDTKYGTHFFTASTDERDTILKTRPDLVNEGVGLTAIDTASKDPNAAAVYRFFDTKYGTHFFTASADERDQVIKGRPDLQFEGTGFYEHINQQAGDTPVYRFFDKNLGTHFYTGDAGERASIVATRSDLVDEGIGFYAPKATTMA